MKNNTFNFCPDCGSKNIRTEMNGRKWFCPDCGFDLYNNVASAVGVIIINSKGEVLFERRAKDPKKGCLDLPGGFTDPDETAEETVKRECLEETSVEPSDIKYLCSFPNTYEYKGFSYKTCDLYYTAFYSDDVELKPQEGEVVSFEFVKFETEEDIDKADLAFVSARNALKFWLKHRDNKC